MFFGQTRFSLVSAMSSMLALGLPIEQIVPMVTTHAAQMIGLQGEIGTLKPGVAADVTVAARRARPLDAARQRRHQAAHRAHAAPAFLPARRRAPRRRRLDPAAARGSGVNPKGVGARLPRKEDRRFLLGQGEYVANIRLAGMLEVAFVRSPVAHARIRDIRKPPGEESSVFTADDLQDVRPIRAVSSLKGFKVSEQPILARDKVRQVGEIVAMCVAPTRAEAEDIADEVELSFDELPAVVDMLQARLEPPALVHEDWGDNVFLESLVEDDLGEATPEAAVAVTRSIRTARQHMSPMEGRGVVCEWNRRLEQLVMYTAAQMPHINRAGLAECLGIDQGAIRVIAPDVGGGFGYKGILLPEEVALAWLCRRLGRAVRWIEDRREQLSANANCREHHYDITLYADAGGQDRRHRLRGDRRLGGVFVLPLLGLPRGGAGRLDPARPLQDGALPLPYLVGGDEQAADPALSRRRAHRRVLRPRAHGRRRRARARHRALRDAPARTSCSRTRCRTTTSPRSTSTAATIPRRCAARRRLIDVPPFRAQKTSPRRARRRRLRHLLRAGGARHLGVLRLGHPDGAGPRAVQRAPHARRRARAAHRRAFARPGHGNHARAGGERNTGHRSGACAPDPRRHRAHALLHRHVGLAQHGDVRRRGRHRVRDHCRPREGHRFSAARGIPGRSRPRGRRGARRRHRPRRCRSRRLRTSGTASRSSCRRTSIPRGSRPPPATRRRSIPERSATPATPPRSRSTPRPGRWRSSIT